MHYRKLPTLALVSCLSSSLFAQAAFADFCFDEDVSWLETGATENLGVWVFEPSPSAMAPSKIPITCFQRDIQFGADKVVTFPVNAKYERNREKCEGRIGAATFKWSSAYSDEYGDWGLTLTTDSNEAIFFFASCTLSEGSPRLTLSAEVISGKVGEVRYVWKARP